MGADKSVVEKKNEWKTNEIQ